MSLGGYRPNSGRKIGSIPWNKGIHSGNHGNGFQKGMTSWNKGVPMANETRQKLSVIRKGRPSPMKGKKFPVGFGKKVSQAKKGCISPNKGKKMSDEQKEKLRIAHLGIIQTPEKREKNRQGQYRRYLKMNPDYQVAPRNKRIADNGGFHSTGEWETLKAQYNWTCPACKKQEPEIKLTKDHIIPLLRGGSDNIENIQPLCKICNCKKHTNTIKY